MNDLENVFAYEKRTARAMQQWLLENCVMRPQAVTPFAALHADWLHWADAHDCYRSSARRLAMALCYVNLQRCVLDSGRVRAYRGIALQPRAVALHDPSSNDHPPFVRSDGFARLSVYARADEEGNTDNPSDLSNSLVKGSA